jgi:hypothetical protein
MNAIRDDAGGDFHALTSEALARDDLAGEGLTRDDRIGDEVSPAAAAARARLAGLRRDAGAVHDSIIAADDELRALAGYRVAAERALLAAGQRRDQAAKALDEHARAHSGLLARLAARLWARRERHARHAALRAALYDCAHSVEAARRAYAQSQARFAATVAARAEAASRLRGLTEACAAAQQAVAGAGDRSAPGLRS